ncbi:MAG TPA: alpha/beta hydrolase [Kofleriaceae bacterium]|nr:alpha/beta hydrolase [Kofleriaceae bacterium]
MTARAAGEELPTVVLLHGLARRAGSLAGLGRAVAAAGFDVRAYDYPSRRRGIAAAAAELAGRLADELPGRPLAAVTHSLGGIVVRHLGGRGLRWQRIVMLAPPNRGSQVAAAFAGNRLFSWFYGPAGRELAAPIDPAAWPAPPAPCAIIAGTRRRALGNPTSWVSHRVFPAGVEHDGTVAVDEARLPGAAFATVDATHTFIMNDARARSLAIAFLRTGALPDA